MHLATRGAVVETGPARNEHAHRGTDDCKEVAERLDRAPAPGTLETGASFRFELALPPDALAGYSSQNGELCWALDAKSDERGRNSRERRRLAVGT